MTKRCLYCYQPIEEHEKDFHASCSKKMFGHSIPPVLPYSEDELEPLAAQIIKSQTTVTGAQPKLSLYLTKDNEKNVPKRFTIVGRWGGYILKPPTLSYPFLPEVEDLTMHLAKISKIQVVPHSLIRLKSGNLAYITKRIDRKGKGKVHMEDMCQLTERLTEEKYIGSYEQIAKAIKKYSTNPGLDVINFFEILLFIYLTGNADMHLKNFSLIFNSPNNPVLSAAYDLVATALVNPADDEDLALTLNGRKKKIKKKDFTAAFSTLKLEKKQQENIFNKFQKFKEKWIEMIHFSFLHKEFKDLYIALISERLNNIID